MTCSTQYPSAYTLY